MTSDMPDPAKYPYTFDKTSELRWTGTLSAQIRRDRRSDDIDHKGEASRFR